MERKEQLDALLQVDANVSRAIQDESQTSKSQSCLRILRDTKSALTAVKPILLREIAELTVVLDYLQV